MKYLLIIWLIGGLINVWCFMYAADLEVKIAKLKKIPDDWDKLSCILLWIGFFITSWSVTYLIGKIAILKRKELKIMKSDFCILCDNKAIPGLLLCQECTDRINNNEKCRGKE